MKKLLSLLLSMSLVFSLAACSGGTASFSENGTSEPSEASTESEEPSSSETPAESTEPKEETGGTLIAYFSWSGHTKQMAQMIQADTGGDLFEIEPATPYTDDYDTLLDVAQQEQITPARRWPAR